MTLTIIHVIISVILILIVLLHFGKGAEAGLVMDSSSSSILPTKGNVMNKITSVLAGAFLVLALLLAILRGKESNQSIMDKMNFPIPTQNAEMPAETPSSK